MSNPNKTEIVKKTSNDLVKPKNLKKYKPPTNISLKEIGSYIEGAYLGVQVKAGQGFNDTDLIIVHLQQEDGKIITCVASFAIKAFLKDTNYKTGYWFKVERIGTKMIKSGGVERPMGEYSFEYDENGIDAISNDEYGEALRLLTSAEFNM